MAIEERPSSRQSASRMVGSPKDWARLAAKSAYSITRGGSALTTRLRPLRSWIVKSASSSVRSDASREGAPLVAVARPAVSVTELLPGEADEDVVERHLAVGRGDHPRVVAVLLDEVGRRLQGEDPAVVHDRHPVADRLRL